MLNKIFEKIAFGLGTVVGFITSFDFLELLTSLAKKLKSEAVL